jgi:hypothetical protein
MSRWNLTGTENQKMIARLALEEIKFPWDRLTALPGTPELGWRDLNPGMGGLWSAEAPRHHEGHHPAGEDRPDGLEGEIDGRRWTMGLIYTQSGRIYLDVRLESQPEVAMAVIAAEVAHAVDFFLPMTDEQRDELLRLWGHPGTTWWEVFDYGDEYFRIGGEAFMHEFVAAFTDLDFGDKTPFLHDAGVEPEDVRRILGIQRTDAQPPAAYKHFPPSKVYHRMSHYPAKIGGTLSDPTGFRPCKVCKP